MAKADVTDDQKHDHRRRDRPRMTRLIGALVGALSMGGAFGALTSHVNAISHSEADLESRAFTTAVGRSPKS